MKYHVAIPSYKRAAMLEERTLATLHRGGVPKEAITVFVADREEEGIYRATLPIKLYREIVVAAPGLGPARNCIARHYPAGAAVVQVDDDMEAFVRKVDDTTIAPLERLDAFFQGAFDFTAKLGLTLWGVYPVLNALFMQHKTTTDLRFVCGGLFGVFNVREEWGLSTISDKEDFERTLNHYVHAGGVVRFNDICFKTKIYRNPGGMQATARTEEQNRANALRLLQQFPDLCSLNETKKSGRTDLRLRDRRPARGTADQMVLL